jgi:hypothetical protein
MTKMRSLTAVLGLIIALQGCGSGSSSSSVIGEVIDTSGRGCGSGWNTKVVRDEFWDVSFDDACKSHDLCYETCGMTKEICDDTFHDAMKAVCEDTFPDDSEKIQKEACLAAARLYFEGVSIVGEDAFSEAQKNCR